MKLDAIRTWGIQAIRRAGWAPLLVFLVHAIASRGFDAYARFPVLDIPMHFLGGVAIAYFFHHAAMAAPLAGLTKGTDAPTHWILVFALTCSSAVFWEFAEFISDRVFGTHAQLGLDDTLGDMLLGILGGLTLSTISILFSGRAHPNAPPSDLQ